VRPKLWQALGLQGPGLVVAGALIVVPAIVLLLTAFSTSVPYGVELGGWTFDNFNNVLQDHSYRENTITSVSIGLRSALLSTVGGLALAYWLIFVAKRRNLWLLLLVLSFIPSYVVRIYAWRTMLGSNGVVVDLLSSLGLVQSGKPVLLFTPWAVVMAQVQIFLPFCTLVIAAALAKVNPALIDQALAGTAMLGAMSFTFFFCTGDYLTPELLGGKSGVTLGYVLASQLQVSGDYATGAALSFVMLVVFVVFYVVLRLLMRSAGLIARTS
jgi:spermidine/putrescine transport system permease protein